MIHPQAKLVVVARRFLGIRETSRNRFHGDVKVWASTDYPDGWLHREPYCAAWVCHVVRIAELEALDLDFNPLPKSPSVRAWREWARKPSSGIYIITQPSQVQAGDIVNMLPHRSHIGIATGPEKDGHIPTIEANTDGDGSREGDGIYEKLRASTICGEFYRLPCRAIAA